MCLSLSEGVIGGREGRDGAACEKSFAGESGWRDNGSGGEAAW